VLERGQTLDMHFVYRLPAVARWGANGGSYTLLVQKQGGAKPRPVSVTLIWPEGYHLAKAEPAPIRQDARSASFEFDLTSDQALSVSLGR